MSDPARPPIIGRLPTAEEDYYLEMGREHAKKSIATLNDFLQRMLALNTALVGGSLVLLKPEVAPAWSRWGAVALFVLSLGASLWGAMPFSAPTPLDSPPQIRDGFEQAASFKDWCVRFAVLTLLAGFLVAIVGVMAGTAAPLPATVSTQS
jgi:hypothetical protein